MEPTNLKDLDRAYAGDSAALGRLQTALFEYVMCVGYQMLNSSGLSPGLIGEVVGTAATDALVNIGGAITSRRFVHKTSLVDTPKKSRLRTYAYSTMRNAVLDLLDKENRKQKREVALDASPGQKELAAPVVPTSLEENEAQEEVCWMLAAIMSGIKALEAKAKDDPIVRRWYQVLQMRGEFGSKFAEIGKQLGIPESTARGDYDKAQAEIIEEAKKDLREVDELDNDVNLRFLESVADSLFRPRSEGSSASGPVGHNEAVARFFRQSFAGSESWPAAGGDIPESGLLAQVLHQVYVILRSKSYRTASRIVTKSGASTTPLRV